MSGVWEEKFFQKIIQEKVPVTVFLTAGVKLQGIIVDQDERILLLRRENHTQMVYKHAVSSVMPSGSVVLS